MKLLNRKSVVGFTVVIGTIVLTAQLAFACLPLVLTAKRLSPCKYVVTATNPEGRTAVIREQTGSVFSVGETIPAHGHLDKIVKAPKFLVNNVKNISVKVNYPPDMTLRESSIRLFLVPCESPSTTTSTTVTSSPPTTQAKVDVGTAISTTKVAKPAESVSITPAFTG